ncbi:MAG: SCO family protein, partial [Candidatus Thiodiazotropha endolucinida]
MFRIIFFSFTLLILFSSAASDEMAQKDEILNSRSESPGGDFVLYSSQGKVSLKQFRGKVVLLYFGYTKCP